MSLILDEKTLVLNRSWRAIHVTTVRRALSLLYQNLAKAVSPDTFEIHDFASWADLAGARGHKCVKAVRLRVPVPEVIVLGGYDGVPVRRPAFSRRNIFRRDRYTCQYCGRQRPSEDLSIDHVVPRSRGGRTSWTNCVIACMRCNLKKGNRSLEAAGMRLQSRPTEPEWAPHLELILGYRRQSWARFVSDRYWDAELEE